MDLSFDLWSDICLLLDTNSVNNIALVSKKTGILITQIYLKLNYWKKRVEQLISRELPENSDNWKNLFGLLVKDKNIKDVSNRIQNIFSYDNSEGVLFALSLGAIPHINDILSCCKRGKKTLVYLLPLVDFNPRVYSSQILKDVIENGHDHILEILLSDGRINPFYFDTIEYLLLQPKRNNKILKLLLADRRCDVQNYMLRFVRQRKPELVKKIILYSSANSKLNYEEIINSMNMKEDIDMDILTLFCQYDMTNSQTISNFAMKIAIENNRINEVKLLAETRGPYCNEYLSSFFVMLVRKRRFKMIDVLFEIGASYINNDALFAAIDSNCINMIVNKFLPPISIDIHYYQRVCDLSSLGQIKLVKLLVQYCQDKNMLTEPLNISVDQGHIDIMWLFLDMEVPFDNSTIELAITANKPEALIALLQSKSHLQIDILNYFIKYACNLGYAEILKILLDVSKTYPYIDNNLCVKNACLNQHIDIVKLLIERGDKPYTNIIYTNDTIKITEFLLSEGYNISSTNEYCMEYACANGHTNIVKILLQKGIDPCINDNICFENACLNGYSDIVTLLLSTGKINRIIRNVNNMMKKACTLGYTDIVKLLFNNDDLDPCVDNNYCIKQVCLKGYVDILKLLLEDYRADPTCDNNYCIINAYKLGHFKIVDELLWDGRTEMTKIELEYKFKIKLTL
jgi:hypothetical protein